VLIDQVAVREQFEAAANDYANAEPFPHAVFDDLLSAELLHAVLAEFPDATSMSTQFQTTHELKFAENNWNRFGPAARQLVGELNSGAFLDSLSALTGIEKLIADASLEGGGMHQIVAGGKLSVHADFTHHPNGLDRRINVLVYLNQDWDPAWAGQLELWARDQSACMKKIDPLFGRVVVFSTLADSFHGHPEPLRTPEGVTRRSMAFYYYSNGRPEPVARHSTRWLGVDTPRRNLRSRMVGAVPPSVRRMVPSSVKSLLR
jgi:Rps23 Pro-64 3,4-dihydroxylase Tpa1-like proline 4-hydroxylase